MVKGGTVNLHVDHVMVKVRDASASFLATVAFQIEAETKVNIQNNGQIDTGFMLNSTYVVTKKSSTFGKANSSGTYTNRKGSAVNRQIVPQESLPGNASAAVVVGADYAIYPEAEKPFLYPAAVKVASQVKGIAEKVYKEGLS